LPVVGQHHGRKIHLRRAAGLSRRHSAMRKVARGPGMRRVAAAAALAFGLAAGALSTVPAIVDFPRSTVGFFLLVLALAAGWRGLVRRRALRVTWMGLGALLVLAD